MNQLINLPYQKAFVRVPFIRQGTQKGGLVGCYLLAVETVLNEALRWMIITEEGFMFNSVPLHALCTDVTAPEVELHDICTWDALGNKGEIIELDFLKNCNIDSSNGKGRYLYSIHFEADTHWARIPEQLKVFHVIERDDHNFAITVNNEMRVIGKGIFNSTSYIIPQSNTRIWFTEDGTTTRNKKSKKF